MEAIERILFDALAHGETVALPELGTLTVERIAAAFESNGSLRPPYYKVVFSPQVRTGCRSLGDEAGYAAWLKGTLREGGVRDLGSAGVLRGDSFEMSQALRERLNPQGVQSVPLHPLHTGRRPAAIVAGVLVAAALVWWIGRNVSLRPEAHMTVSVHTEQWGTDPLAQDPWGGDEVAEAEPAGEVADTTAAVTAADAASAAQTETAAETGQNVEASGPMYHVVVGVFSEEENADKLIASDPLKIGGERYRKVAFRGNKILVSAFAATDRASADSCRRALSRRNGDLWVYEAR